MPEITFEKAKEFLEKINEKDNIAVVHHDDTDGFASGLMLYDWCKKKSAKVQQFTISLGDNQQKIIDKLKPFNKILFSDLAFLTEELLNSVKEKEVLSIDHHIKEEKMPEEILDYRTESKISASKSVYSMIYGRKWLEIVSELADVGYSYPENKVKIDRFAKEHGIAPEEVKEKFYFRIDLFLAYFHKDYNKAFEIFESIEDYNDLDNLDKYANEVQKELDHFMKDYENKREKLGMVNYYYFEPKFPIKSRVTTNISFKHLNEVFVFAIPKGNKINISARNQSGDYDCSKILKKATEGLKDSLAGGHSKASGGIIFKEDLEKFKENLAKITAQ
ncbi:MAG: DHH family phosphoesterase [Candidatus Pacearchaeota archaeon]